MSAARFSILFSCILLLGGCSSGQSDDTSADGSLFSEPAPQQHLVNIDNGLEVRKWLIEDKPDLIAAELMRIAEPADLDESIVERLERNGFRLLRIPGSAVDRLAESLGGATQDHSEWFGQAPLWQPLHETGVGRGGQAVAIDGKVARYDNGRFQLMVRSWTLPMEDGPHVQVEFMPQFRPSRPLDYRELLRGPQSPSTRLESPERTAQESAVFPTLAFTLRLDPEQAYVLVGASPQQAWPADDNAAAPRAPSRGPGPGFGPDTVAPKTLGELMLIGETSPRMRGMLVFVAKIPGSLYPAGYERSVAQGDLAGGE